MQALARVNFAVEIAAQFNARHLPEPVNLIEAGSIGIY